VLGCFIFLERATLYNIAGFVSEIASGIEIAAIAAAWGAIQEYVPQVAFI
jgi:hypothetical protein